MVVRHHKVRPLLPTAAPLCEGGGQAVHECAECHEGGALIGCLLQECRRESSTKQAEEHGDNVDVKTRWYGLKRTVPSRQKMAIAS
mgnify:CR=1 FL=1